MPLSVLRSKDISEASLADEAISKSSRRDPRHLYTSREAGTELDKSG
jgi:hypothetical protein